MGWRSDIYSISFTNHRLFRYGVRQMGSFSGISAFLWLARNMQSLNLLHFTFLNLDISSLVPGLFQIICVLDRQRMSQSMVRTLEWSSGLGEICRCPALETV